MALSEEDSKEAPSTPPPAAPPVEVSPVKQQPTAEKTPAKPILPAVTTEAPPTTTAQAVTQATEEGDAGAPHEKMDAASEAKLKSALEDRKLLRKHARRLEGELAESKKVAETKASELEAAKAQLESALEDRKLLRRHARQRDEAGTEAAREAARLKKENEQLLKDISRREERAARFEAESKEDRHLLEVAKAAEAERETLALAERKRKAEEDEQQERERRETLRESQVVVAALKEEVSRLRTALAEAETKVVTERARGDAARRAATSAAAAAQMADDAVKARSRAARCEAEAQFAADLRKRDDVIGEMHSRQVKDLEDLKQQTALTIASGQKMLEDEQKKSDATIAAVVAAAALKYEDLAAAANATFLALSDSFVALVMHTDEQFQQRDIQAKTTPAKANNDRGGEARSSSHRKQPSSSAQAQGSQGASSTTTPEKKTPKSTHEWRHEKIRVTLLRRDVGLEVDAFGRVTRVRGEALKAGVAFGDKVLTLATAPVDDFVDFGTLLEKSARPVVLDLDRSILVEKDRATDDDDLDGGAADGDSGGFEQEQQWREVKTNQPCPAFGVDSPEVTHLLRQWSADKKKLQYVKLWLAVAADSDGNNATAPAQFPRGLQLPALRHELLHGFLALVVPVLKRARGDHAVDVKIRTSLVTAPSPAASSASSTTKKANEPLDDDEYAQRWDLALKVDIPASLDGGAAADGVPDAKKKKPPKDLSQQQQQQHHHKGGAANDDAAANKKASRFSRGSSKKKQKDDDDDLSSEELARQKKVADERRKAVEDKLAKMRLATSTF
eukprot:CAMPEP_0118901702 /NCGR_PEP_ID=MMETSP1166-20130328/7303_1 /TAXON_ID=1104430 /ORGANISM="Chrysoreinhardia sp, Strain CCMP3193" /LENGTH=791 /DNA_ID=CAMNT_0006840885 /DNA_START=1 /DNA_END=2376 /DNA_ORIENTATION=+